MDPYSVSCLLQVYKPWDPEVIWKDVIYTSEVGAQARNNKL